MEFKVNVPGVCSLLCLQVSGHNLLHIFPIPWPAIHPISRLTGHSSPHPPTHPCPGQLTSVLCLHPRVSLDPEGKALSSQTPPHTETDKASSKKQHGRHPQEDAEPQGRDRQPVRHHPEVRGCHKGEQPPRRSGIGKANIACAIYKACNSRIETKRYTKFHFSASVICSVRNSTVIHLSCLS